MPTIEVSYKDIRGLIGKRIDLAKLRDEDILYAKGEVDSVVGDVIKIDIKDTNRPDLWSAEGVAREIRYRYSGGFPKYKTKKSSVAVNIDESVKNVRPLTVCAVVRGLKITGVILSQLIQLQEKVAGTFGRNRKEVAIGVYDLHKIKPPIKYTTVKPDGIKFIPLDFEKALFPYEILQKHQKGKEFGHLLKGAERYPIFIDSAGNVLSMPPIINSAYTGKVTEKTKDVFIECSGFDFRFLMPALNVIVAALHERGGKIETVDVLYAKKKMTTPTLEEKKFSADVEYINKVSGLGLDGKTIVTLLEKSGYAAQLRGNKINVAYPAYRQDIMHVRDVAEDVIITYGMNRIEPAMRKLATAGKANEAELTTQKMAEILVGCGLQEILSYTLTNKRDLFEKMNVTGEPVAEVENPVSANWCVFRNWLTPGLMDFLSKNRHIEYPHRIFEAGICVVLDEKQETRTRDIRKLAAAISNSVVSYDEISSVLDAFMKNFGIKYELKKSSHGSFVSGRCAEILVGGRHAGIVGEVSPQALNNWRLEKPVVAFELNIEELIKN